MHRVNWYEDRRLDNNSRERTLVVAKRIGESWRFYEISIWDTCWYELSPTPELRKKAEERDKKKIKKLNYNLV